MAAAAVTALGASWIQNEQNKKESSSISNKNNKNIENPLLDNILRLNPPSIISRFNADNKISTLTTTTTSCDGGIMPSKRNTGPRRNVMLHRKRSVRARHLDDKYIVDWSTVMGEGAYGSVHPARLRQTGQKVALKRISKRYTSADCFRSETDALLRLYDNGGHPNISGLRDMYEDATHFYLILDLVSGGEMFEHLIEYGAYSEADAARLMQEVASALAFLHGVGVVHADLKPENLLLCSKKKSDGTIKIIDFGCAVLTEDEQTTSGSTNTTNTKKNNKKFNNSSSVSKQSDAESTGTTAYWPPERFLKKKARGKNRLDGGIDMWSVGVILFIMLCGVHPFDLTGVSTDEEIEANIQANPYPPIGELTSHLSPSAIDLIEKLMSADPSKRLTASEMLKHPWITGETASTSVMVDSDKKLSRFKDLSQKLEAGIFAVLVSQGNRNATLSEAVVVKEEETPTGGAPGDIMKRAFETFDISGKGVVTSEDLTRVVSELTGTQLSSSDSEDMILAALDAHEKKSTGSSSSSTLSLSDFSKLFSKLRHTHFPKGHVIFNAGDEGDAMYFINAGKVDVLTRKGQLVSILRSGDFFGEGSLLEDDSRRFTTAKCATPVDLIKITKQDFQRYISSSATAEQDLKVKWKARSLKYAKNLLRLQRNVKKRVFRKGDVVYKEGDAGKSMFLVDEQDGGTLDVLHDNVVVHQYVGGDSFGESSLVFQRPRSSTVICTSDEKCLLHEMNGSDFLKVLQETPDVAQSLRDMCRKRLFKKAVKKMNVEKRRGFGEDDLVAAFREADVNNTGILSLNEVRDIMHRLDPNFPESEIVALLKFMDVDGDGSCSLKEFKRIFRCFENMEKGN
eukprot:CAMPEP_0178949188 /NCGR_PEP_ID=MMETSP0789-20121207/5897_1 /TAXON_ID=3005 /ORGANISM="Rhizosolenia setigera, Strain CCMP 1694" /LENGTH=852 /DNA_ID=CAMNT_0020629653 /DNA_START=178 /DNA_END=2736 /DNA_ORIENTATION=-